MHNILIKSSRFSALVIIAMIFAQSLFGVSKRQTTILPGSVKNFELPNFNDATGVKEWEVFGDKANYISDERIDVEKMKLNLFDGTDKATIKAVITSPLAQVNSTAKIVDGPSEIFVDGDGFDLSGKKWKWNGDKKFIEIFSDVNINIASKEKSDKDSKKTLIKSQYASLDHSGKDNKFALKKDVSVIGEDMVLHCQSMDLDAKRDSTSDEKVSKIFARTNVKFEGQNKRATADAADIDPANSMVILTGNPTIEDLGSKALLNSWKIVLDKNKKELQSYPAPDGSKRTTSTFFNVSDKGEKQKIEILSDSAFMQSEDKKSTFHFDKNVSVFSTDFKAKCDNLTAIAKSDTNQKPNVEIIKGSGAVKLDNENGSATAKKIEIFPNESQVWLYENASLKDAQRGYELYGETMVFEKEKNKGMVFSNNKDKKSFVRTVITQTPQIEGISDSKANKKSPSKTNILSRRLKFSRNENDIKMTFAKDVSIKSDDIDAVCQKVDVFANSSKSGSAKIQKIVASDGVVVNHKDYIAKAELANIYPKLENQESSKEKIHKFIELLLDPQNPGNRPSITLPAVGNIGLEEDELAKKSESKPTVIISDKQWLTSSPDADRYFFDGDVKISGTDMNATCKRIEVVMKSQKKNAPKEITHIILSRDVKIAQGLKDATCGRADIYPKEEMIVLSQNPAVYNRQDNTRASGFRMVYNKGNKSVAIEADNSATQQSSDEETNQRPTIVLPSFDSFGK